MISTNCTPCWLFWRRCWWKFPQFALVHFASPCWFRPCCGIPVTSCLRYCRRGWFCLWRWGYWAREGSVCKRLWFLPGCWPW
ncbi:hypothetical protein DFH27DRAFT_585697 [Peziza echinospora]|nr:hypothetical protein DFH27DRAFT_585697 [Peziza echinospora]